MSLDHLVGRATSRAGVVRVSNVLNSLLWGSATATPICFGFAYLFGNDPLLHYGLVALGALPILAMIGAYIYFMLRDPDRLQSEEFLNRQHEIAFMERKSAPPLSIENNQPIESPHLRTVGSDAPRTP